MTRDGGRGHAKRVSDWLRLFGGIAVAAGAVVLVLRKAGAANAWGDWAQFAGLAVPFAGLYATALVAGHWKPGQPAAAGWRTAFLIVAVALLPLVFEQFLDAIGHPHLGSREASWISFATAGAAGFASFRVGSSFLVFPAVLLSAIGGLFFIDWVGNPQLETVRKLAFASAVGCALFAAAIRGRRPGHAAYAIDAAGILAVTAASFGAFAIAIPVQFSPFQDTTPPGAGNGWETLLLLSSLGLIAYTAATRFPGPAYIGSIGLALFVIAVGDPFIGKLANFGQEPGFSGWPALLIIGGAVALATSFGAWRFFYEPKSPEPDSSDSPPAG